MWDEYSDYFEERGMVMLLAAGQQPMNILGPRQHRAYFGHLVANGREGAVYLKLCGLMFFKGNFFEVDTVVGVIEFFVDRAEAEFIF